MTEKELWIALVQRKEKTHRDSVLTSAKGADIGTTPPEKRKGDSVRYRETGKIKRG